MTCCNRELTTPFCPMCGKASENPLMGLLRHLRTQQGSHELVADEFQSEANNPAVGTRAQKRLARLTENAAKWKAWADALETLIAKQEAA